MRSTPPLARARFLREWEDRSLATLFAYTRQTMPEDNPGSLTDQEFADIIAYMLSVNRMPAGDNELPPEPRGLARDRHPAAAIARISHQRSSRGRRGAVVTGRTD